MGQRRVIDRQSTSTGVVGLVPHHRYAIIHAGFSLLELLVVLAVVLVLTGMIIPAMASVREQANRMMCSSNMRQLGIATTMFVDDKGHLPESRYANGPNVQELMAAHNGHGIANENWEGFGELIRDHYLDNPEVCYCPSHRGEHTYDRYAALYGQYYSYPGLWEQARGEIYTNYQYAGNVDWTQTVPIARSLLDPGLVLATDGLRSWDDFNHMVGMNVLKGDISVNWREDRWIADIRDVLQGNGQVANLGAYQQIWEMIENP